MLQKDAFIRGNAKTGEPSNGNPGFLVRRLVSRFYKAFMLDTYEHKSRSKPGRENAEDSIPQKREW